MLLPYTIFAARPSNTNTSVTSNATKLWAAPAVRDTTHEICRVITKMWASGLMVGVGPFYPPEQGPQTDHIYTLMGKWKEDMTRLISWLNWSVGCATCLLGPWGFSRLPVLKTMLEVLPYG
ncbi:hypothetical protein BDR04DRAFT_1123064 [Suillus decipiens]|nr:hypothetical protein BDR04DRAFT_1123064 [Suillus decipiens]